MLMGLKLFNIDFNISGFDFDFSPAVNIQDKIADILLNNVKRHWQNDENPNGKWPTLAASTWASKTSGKMLYETGNLIDSLEIISKDGDKVEVGFTADYSKYHEEGTRNLPQRSSIWISESELDVIENLIFEMLEEIWSN